ncbi:MAG: nucleotide exchange factor GrpE [Candidatus Omnitrophota bacterium]
MSLHKKHSTDNHHNSDKQKEDTTHLTDAPLNKNPGLDKEEPHQEQNKEMISILKTELEELKAKAAKADEYLDKMFRIEADAQNLKKRLEKQRADFFKYANETLLRELLSVLDDFTRANQYALKNEDYDVLHKGVEMIIKRMNELLKANGVKEIEAQGKMFDPYQHEAVMHVETSEHEDNIVVEELKKGYMMYDKVLLPAMVKVAKKIEKKEEKEID